MRFIYDIIVIVIQKKVAGSAGGGCIYVYGTATGQTLEGVRSRPTTEEETHGGREGVIDLGMLKLMLLEVMIEELGSWVSYSKQVVAFSISKKLVYLHF